MEFFTDCIEQGESKKKKKSGESCGGDSDCSAPDTCYDLVDGGSICSDKCPAKGTCQEDDTEDDKGGSTGQKKKRGESCGGDSDCSAPDTCYDLVQGGGICSDKCPDNGTCKVDDTEDDKGGPTGQKKKSGESCGGDSDCSAPDTCYDLVEGGGICSDKCPANGK